VSNFEQIVARSSAISVLTAKEELQGKAVDIRQQIPIAAA
jgi:hypothetical protein